MKEEDLERGMMRLGNKGLVQNLVGPLDGALECLLAGRAQSISALTMQTCTCSGEGGRDEDKVRCG